VLGTASLNDMRTELTVGRDVLRRLLEANGVARRPSGHNTPAGKRSRAHRADELAAARLGVSGVRSYIAERLEQG
jgi:hypothetical protein